MNGTVQGRFAHGFASTVREGPAATKGATMTKCSFRGSLIADKTVGAANIVNMLGGINYESTLEECYASAYLEGSNCNFIGTVGPMSRIENCYGLLNIKANTFASAVGILPITATANIENSYFVLDVSNTSETASVGSIFTQNSNADEAALLGTLTNVYYNKDTLPSAFESSAETTYEAGAKTTAELKTQSTYQDWDFTNVWAINPNKNNGYPYLRALENTL